MTEQAHNNSPSSEFEKVAKLDDEFIPDDAWPLCPNCLKPCNPLQNYCDNCDSNEAINPLASYMPFVRIRFVCGMYGKVWRKICYDKRTSIVVKAVYLLMIIMFAPVLLVFGLAFLLIGRIRNPHIEKAATIILYIVAVVLGMFFAFSVKF